MKKKDLYDALSGIDEKYLSDSENFSEISVEFRHAKVRKIGAFSSLCSCLIIIAVAVFLDSYVTKNNFDNFTEPIEKSTTIQTTISEVAITTDDNKKFQNTTEITENNSVEPTEKSFTTDISVTIDNTDVQTEFLTIETSEIPATDIIVPTSDNPFDGYDKTDFSGICIDEWLENPDVIWSENDTKGYLNSEYIQSGNTKISEKLSDLMQNNSDDAVYAVMVDFSSCIDENELLYWEYNGDTIADLKVQISESTEYSENSYTHIGSDGTEHVEYFLTSESEVKVTEFERRINEIKSAYRDMKIQEFRDSFHDNGLEIYTDRISGVQEENFCFYTFATRKHLEEFKCRSNEAFIFYPANYFK